MTPTEAYEAVMSAAIALLVRIDQMTSEQFSRGEERPEREALRGALLVAISASATEVTS